MTTTPYSMDVPAAAAYIGLSADAIKRAINADQLPARQYRSDPAKRGGKWLIRTADLEAWYEALDGNYAANKAAS